MSVPDIINGSFELCAGLFLCLNIRRLFKDKQVRGVHWVSVGFFALWGYWNLYYYPFLGQWISFLGGIMVVTANTAWLIQIIYYTWNIEAPK